MEFFFTVFQNSCEEIGTSDVGSRVYVEFIIPAEFWNHRSQMTSW